MRKHALPLTYAPKIPAVLEGRCTQTIRAGRRFQIGDFLSSHGWSGKPYRSPWSFRTPYWEVSAAHNCMIEEEGIDSLKFQGEIGYWYWDELDRLADLDYIDPPTGEELGRVLLAMHRIPDEGLPAQIIRWTTDCRTSGSDQ